MKIDYKKLSSLFDVTLYPNESESQIAGLRLSVCIGCEELDFDGRYKICKKCGCIIGAKALQRGGTCPLKKWKI